MNLAFKYPVIFWNCACLICDSGSSLNPMTNSEEEEEENEENETEEKAKKSVSNYGKIATAIGKMKAEGIKIVPPNINKSMYTFSPDEQTNSIIFGLNGITRVGGDIVKEILKEREKGNFTSLEDFLSRTKFNRLVVINLIKCGAFDSFGERNDLMSQYIKILVPGRKALNIASTPMLQREGFFKDKEELDLARIYNFNKYLSKNVADSFYFMDEYGFNFYMEMGFDLDVIFQEDDIYKIKKDIWTKLYTPFANKLRTIIKTNKDIYIEELNKKELSAEKEKYCKGNYSTWEMDSISCYIHNHELENLNESKYGVKNFFNQDENSEIDRIINIKGKQIPLYKIYRIAGTVLDRDKLKHSVTILTTNGVVTVKIYGDAFSKYDRQISEMGEDGKKHVIEKSVFSRGTKIFVTGLRRGNEFICKKYKNTPYHLVEKIEEVYEDGSCKTSIRE